MGKNDKSSVIWGQALDKIIIPNTGSDKRVQIKGTLIQVYNRVWIDSASLHVNFRLIYYTKCNKNADLNIT